MNKLNYILGVLLLVTCFQAEALAKSDDVVIKEVQGFVQIQRINETDWIKAEANETLNSGDKIRTLLKSSAVLIFTDGSEFQLRENTSLDIKDVSQNIQNKTAKRELKLNLGSLHYKVPPKKEKAIEFKIHSSTSIVGITGTEGVVTSKGDGKPSENILIEGATYNTNDQGQEGRYQTKGNVYANDGQSAQIYSAKVGEEILDRMTMSEEHVDKIKAVVAVYKQKRDAGYNVDVIEIVIKQAFFYLEKHKYKLVDQMVARSELLLEGAQKIDIPTEIKRQVSDIYQEIKDKEAAGFDTSEVYALYENVRTLMHKGYFKDIPQEITGIQQKLALSKTSEEGDTFLSLFQNIQLKVIEKEKQGFVLGEIKSILRQSRIYYEQEDKPKAYQLINDARERLALVLRNVSDSFLANLDRLKEKIALKKTDGYPTRELELRFEEAKVFIKEEDYLKARKLVKDMEVGLLVINKGISVEWQIKINEIKDNITYKKSMGYDLNKIYGDLGKLEDYQVQGDLVGLEALVTQIKTALDQLKLPAGFEASHKVFLAKKKEKESLGFNMKEVDDLSSKVQGAIDKGDITSARSFLKKAQEVLDVLSDAEPPKVQVLSFEEANGKIMLEGFASDNTRLKNIFVNHSIVPFSEDGKFSYSTVITQSLVQITILAEDIKGNSSAP